MVNLKTAGPYTLVATAGSFTGASGSFTVVPSMAVNFIVTAPATAITGSPFNITLTAMDQYRNLATGYNGTVQITSSIPAGSTLVGSYQFTTGPNQDNGTHTFSVMLNTAGSQRIMATDAVSSSPTTIIGSSGPITTRGLMVTSFAPTSTGFTASFSKAFLPADLTLYGQNQTTVKDVVLTGAHVGPIHGSLLVDPSNMKITFKATSSYLLEKNSLELYPAIVSAVLPDDTYTVTLISGTGSNGFMEGPGLGLDGANNAGQANYVATFTTSYQHNATPVLGIADFARGPNNNAPIAVPNESAAGIPITLYNATGVTDVTFTLTYNPLFLNITGALQGAKSDATDPNGTFTLNSNNGGVATFTFHNATPQAGMVVLGDIVATVPNSAANLYQAKELLQIGGIVINNGAITGAVASDGIHVNAYLGDVSGDGILDGLDTLMANQVAIGAATGFSAYQLLDPVVIGDVAGDLSVDAGDVSVIDLYVAHLQPALQIPVLPGLAVTAPNAADPTVSLVVNGERGGTRGLTPVGSPAGFVVSVLLDHPHPAGSTGLTEAVLALTYDPKMLSVSPADITLGSIPSHGTGWHISAVVDQTTGQIGIELYSLTPITANQAGSLVNIVFHVQPGEPTGVSPRVTQSAVQLVDTVSTNGQQFSTELADTQGAMILSAGVDRVVVGTVVDAVSLAATGGLTPRRSFCGGQRSGAES